MHACEQTNRNARAHTHTPTQTQEHARTHKHLFHFYIHSHWHAHSLTRTCAPSSSASLIKSSVMFIWDRETEMEWRGGLPNKVKNIRDNNNSSTHCSMPLFSLPACHSSALLANVCVPVSMCVLHVGGKRASRQDGIQATALFWCGHAN